MPTPLAMVWDLIARDAASPVFGRVAASADAAAVSTERASTSIGGFGKLIAGAFAVGVVVDFGVKAAEAATSFQQAMLLIQTQAGASKDEVNNMSAAVLALAGPVAQSPMALADALYHIESVGLRGAQALDVLKIAAEGAKVGHTDLTDTTNALTASVASGIGGVQNMSQAMGALNAIVGAGDMKMSDLNEALGSGLLAVVKGYGLNLSDVGAALATFGDNNIRGADAATMLRMAVQAMAVPAAKGKSTIEGLGLTMSTLANDEKTGGLNKAITDLHDHLDAAGVSGAGVGQVLTEAFGKKAGPGLAVLLGQFDRLQSKYAAVNKGAGTFTSAWDATRKTAGFAFDSLKSNLEAIGIKIGTALLPPLAKVATGLSNFFQSVANNPGLAAFIKSVGTDLVDAFKHLAPVFDAVVSVGKDLIGFYKDHSELVQRMVKGVIGAAVAVGVLSTAIGAFAGAVIYAYKHSQTFRDVVNTVWTDIKTVWGVVFRDVITPLFEYLKREWPIIAANMSKFYYQHLAPLWDEFKKAVVQVWGYVEQMFDYLKSKWPQISSDLSKIYFTYVKPVWDAFTAAVRWLWQNVLSPFLDWVKTHWPEISAVIAAAWGVIKPVFDAFVSAIVGIIDNFANLKDNAVKIWDAIKATFLGGVNAVIGTIDQLLTAINKITGIFGIPAIPMISPVGGSYTAAPTATPVVGGAGQTRGNGFALGGVLPGYTPGVDVHRFYSATAGTLNLSGGEGIIVPEAVRGLGGAAGIRALNASFSNRVPGGGGSFAGGGVLGAAGAVLSGNPLGAVTALANTALSAIPAGVFRQLAGGVVAHLLNGLTSFIATHPAPAATGGAPGTPGGPVGDHLALIKQALGLSGVPDLSQNESAVNIIVTHESGWNPNAINRTDSNAQAGHPSQGLMQTIPSTFEGNRLPSLPDNILDPLANMVAGIRYAVRRYGSLLSVPGVRAVNDGGSYVGYDSGGLLMPGVTPAINLTGKPEAVFTNDELQMFKRMAVGGGVDGATIVLDAGSIGQLTGTMYVVAGHAMNADRNRQALKSAAGSSNPRG